jgi:hypothetical protein
MSVGQRQRVAVTLKGGSRLGPVLAVLHFDPKVMRVVGNSPGGLLKTGEGAQPTASVDPGGVVIFVGEGTGEQPAGGEGTLFFVEVEALAPGDGALWLDGGAGRLTARDGSSLSANAGRAGISVKQ